MADKKLTIERSMADFKRAYRAKHKLIERQKQDFLFCFGKQWSEEKENRLKAAGINPVVDNRIRPNTYLITGLERQNRSDFKAFPEGEEDSIKAEIASALFKHSIKQSDFGYKASDVFEDGIICGESYLELYLDNTYNILNAKPIWKKIDANMVFPDPASKEYDFSDARYVYKLTVGLSREDLIALYPDKAKEIEKAENGKMDIGSILGGSETHLQKKDYGKEGGDLDGLDQDEENFDLVERYYKKWVKKTFIGDKKTGEIKEAETQEKAEEFVLSYREQIAAEQAMFMEQQQQALLAPQIDEFGNPIPQEPIVQPNPQDPERFIVFTRLVPEMWIYAHVNGVKKALADEVAWYYPKWKGYGLVRYLAHFSTAPIEGDDRHLLIQGVVHGVKGVQEKHNSSETLKMMHLNSSSNSGWLSEEDSWVDPKKVEQFGSAPGINLTYKKGSAKPERIFPMPLSQGHNQIAQESADAIKEILGINADLLAAQDGGQSSGRAIALRQRQGLLMVQKLFDNLSRTKQIAGRFLLSQLGELYDTETAKKVLGEDFLMKNFPPPTLVNEETLQPEPMKDETGQPMLYDVEMADLAIAEVLSGDLGQYDVAVGESVASETMKLANAAELQELAAQMPGLISPDILVEESQLNSSTKARIMKSISQAQAMAAPQPGNLPPLGVAV